MIDSCQVICTYSHSNDVDVMTIGTARQEISDPSAIIHMMEYVGHSCFSRSAGLEGNMPQSSSLFLPRPDASEMHCNGSYALAITLRELSHE